ncbi:hypothetical protein PV326_012947, partial [Microctonus aethiopoides]
RQPSLDPNAGWNDNDQLRNTSGYSQPVINYGSTETNANPFHSTNPFATDIRQTAVQPPATDDYSHDVMQQQQQQQWN